MKKEYLQQFEELNEEELSELIDDLTKMWWDKKHEREFKEEEITIEDEKIAMYYEKDKQDSLDSLNNI
jgi:DNA-directed RNA polymerase subunit F